MTFKPRLSEPSTTDKHWIKYPTGYNKCMIISGNSVLPNCVGYAWGRFLEILGKKSCKLSTGNAGTWYSYKKDGYSRGSKPKVGAVACWAEIGKAGHVAIVEKINSDGSIVTSESGYDSKRFWTKTRTNSNGRWGAGPTYIFQGFIYNPNSDKGYGGSDIGDSDSIPKNNGDTLNYMNDLKDLINVSAINPYIATIGPKYLNTSYSKLKKAGVVGVMLYAGSLYDTVHMERKYYRGDNLKLQVEQADKAEMPYGLYADVKARSVAEAKKECEQLYYIVSKYPPQLGIWLSLQLVKSTTLNNSILKEYYENIKEWGLKDRCGLYVTRSQLSTITWDKFYDRFWLWIIDRTSKTSEFEDELLDPKFFEIDKK